MRQEATIEQFDNAIKTIQTYRTTFSTPLIKVNNGLRSFVRTLKIEAEVSQRLKRLSTIIEKLTTRETGLDLSRMRDIGGCRVVLENDSVENLYKILHKMETRWGKSIIRVIDYVNNPRSSGYRAIHVEVERDERTIEVQLRTKTMHEWAQTSEFFSYIFQKNYKQDGTSIIQNYMFLLSKYFQYEEKHIPWTDEEQVKLVSASAQVRQLINLFLEEENNGQRRS